ncbi:MAG: Rrf2 family transcriptional regulator [Ignavibacteria bacterium]|nr:Rrf2 family transcriptional regulator [Ignavibacteria bacterium]
MSTIFSKSCEYALQSMLYIARKAKNQPILLRDISTELNIPYHFLSKVLQNLVRDGLVVSHRGINGGFFLGRSAEEITLFDIICAIEGKTFFDNCILGFPKCSDEYPCPAHFQWKDAKSILLEVFQRKTVAELSIALDPKLELVHKLSGMK